MAPARSARILGAALQLPPRERARVAHELLVSLHPSDDDDVERAWIEEAERRWEEVRAGGAKLFDSDAVLRDARRAAERTRRPAKTRKKSMPRR